MPDLAAFDLDAHDAGALDGHDEVDLVILEMVGDALTRHDEIIGLELVDQRSIGAALGALESGLLIGRDAHAAGFPSTSETTMALRTVPRSAGA